MMSTRWDDRGLTLIEVMIASLILMVGIAGLLTTFPAAYTNVVASGGETKAVTYAQEKIEELKNQAFPPLNPPNPPPITGNDAPEAGYTRTWSMSLAKDPKFPFAETTPPNRVVRIAVTVTWTEGAQQRQAQSVTLETLRLEE